MLQLLIGAAFPAITDPWTPGYSFQKRLLITNLSPVEGTAPLHDFPVLIVVTNAAWLDPWQARGGDITFVGMDGSQLFHDLEYFGVDLQGRATLQAWVCIPTWTNRTAVWMYWRNSAPGMDFVGSNTLERYRTTVSTFQNPVIQSLVWDPDYLVVMHFSERAGLPRDITRYGCHASQVGSNISSNRAGIGIGMGNRMQSDFDEGWGGYHSENTLYTAQNGPGWQGMFGVRIAAFAAAQGLNRAADRLYSNGLAGGTLTHSLWMRFEDYPSNYYKGLVLAGGLPGSKYTNYVPATNYSTAAAIWGLRRAWGEPDSDGYGSFWITATNGYPNFYYRSRFGQVPALRITNTNEGPAGYYAGWTKYDQVCDMDYLANQVSMRIVKNGAPVYSNRTAPGSESGPKFNGLTLMGSTYEYIPATGVNLRGSPKATFDEYRLSASARSSNWLLNEYSNVVGSTHMAFENGLDGGVIENVADWFANYLRENPIASVPDREPDAIESGVPVAFDPTVSEVLRLEIPGVDYNRRVIIRIHPLVGGSSYTVWDGEVAPTQPLVEIPTRMLRSLPAPAVQVVVFRYPVVGKDRSQVREIRKMLFFIR
ncbi:MAG: hypothetical protein J0L75_04465 [Spirochaetes bacterium]|nr:hypothetical protein [Spirochaetota bacterium]